MPPIRELSRDYEDELDAAENVGQRGVSLWIVWTGLAIAGGVLWWRLIAMAGYLVWKVR